MRKRFLHLAVALGLITGLFVGAIAPAAAAPEDPGVGAIFFPWVPNDDSLAGIDGITGSVTVQNLEIYPVDVTIEDAAGNELTTLTLNPRASQTWTADDLGIAAPGSGVVAFAEWANVDDLLDAGMCLSGEVELERSDSEGTVDSVTLPDPAPAALSGVVVTQGGFTFPADSYNVQYANGTLSIDWSPSGPEPQPGAYTVTYLFDCPVPRIAGAEKHTTGTTGPRTSADTEIVDGYTALPVQDLIFASAGGATLEGQSRWVLPIVQTNNGWNTEFVITNVWDTNTSVTATFYAAEGQGYAGEAITLISGQVLAPGESVTVDLMDDAGFPEEVVGSVWIDASRPVVAAAFRNKPSTDMMLTTLAQPRTDLVEASPTEKFGALVFRDYNGWNTGINIANLSSVDNRVTVTYYNYAGNVVATDSRIIPARAMEYVYTPATGSFGIGANQITAARIAGTAPLAAAIDEVKYLDGQDQWHAMSYAASRAQAGGDVVGIGDRVLYESLLGLPLVQKGNPTTGFGDTSGINLYNPAAAGVTAAVQFLDSAGVPVAPTVDPTDAEAPYDLPLPAGAGATLYTLELSEMPAGFQGSAVVGVVGDGYLVGVSNNVNYEVAGDGSATFNLAPTSFVNFGVGFSIFQDADELPVGSTQTVLALVDDAFGNVAGVPVECTLTEDSANADAEITQSDVVTDANGEVTCSWTGTIAGTDTLQVWADLNGNGEVDPGEVRSAATLWGVEAAALTATPETADPIVGDGPHAILAALTDADANQLAGYEVVCEVTEGPNVGAGFTYDPADGLTDADGQIQCSYEGDEGTDTVEVRAYDSIGNVIATTTVEVNWTLPSGGDTGDGGDTGGGDTGGGDT